MVFGQVLSRCLAHQAVVFALQVVQCPAQVPLSLRAAGAFEVVWAAVSEVVAAVVSGAAVAVLRMDVGANPILYTASDCEVKEKRLTLSAGTMAAP